MDYSSSSSSLSNLFMAMLSSLFSWQQAISIMDYSSSSSSLSNLFMAMLSSLFSWQQASIIAIAPCLKIKAWISTGSHNIVENP
jgi:hypothetical protein